jgi:hypothetical protein
LALLTLRLIAEEALDSEVSDSRPRGNERGEGDSATPLKTSEPALLNKMF